MTSTETPTETILRRAKEYLENSRRDRDQAIRALALLNEQVTRAKEKYYVAFEENQRDCIKRIKSGQLQYKTDYTG